MLRQWRTTWRTASSAKTDWSTYVYAMSRNLNDLGRRVSKLVRRGYAREMKAAPKQTRERTSGRGPMLVVTGTLRWGWKSNHRLWDEAILTPVHSYRDAWVRGRTLAPKSRLRTRG